MNYSKHSRGKILKKDFKANIVKINKQNSLHHKCLDKLYQNIV